MASLYKDLVRAGIPTDHHESDLYVLDTPAARETVKKYGYKFQTFTSNIDGKRWLDVSFAYEPFWEKKTQARMGAASGERTVEAATRKPAHARKRSAWPAVIGTHDLGTADVRTGDGAYWIVTVPTGHRVDYKPWGPSNEVDLGTFSSRQRARTEITKHAGGAGAGPHSPKMQPKRARAKRSHATVTTAEGRVLKCDMSKTCEEPVTHLDEKGFVYCTKHGIQRRGSGHRCRKLSPSELGQLKRGEALARY
jgi:hypothetical protein